MSETASETGSETAAGLFRPEAVAYHDRGVGPGNLLRHAAWVRWAFWAMLVAVVAALVASAFVRVSPAVTAPLGVDAGTNQTTVLVTVSGHSGLRAGLAVTTSDGRRGEVDQVQAAPVSDVLRGAELAVRVSLDGGTPRGGPAGATAKATIHLPSEPLAVFVFPGLRGLLGD